MTIAPAIADGLATLASALVGLRAARGVAGDADADRVLARLDRDVLGDRRGAALAPRLEPVAAGRQALEREPAVAVGDDVGRRGDHRDERGHVRVQVAAEPDDALLLERELAGLVGSVQPE